MAFFSPADQAKGDVIDVAPDVNLDNFTLSDLLKLRADIDRRLPARSIRDIDLSRELVLQFLATQELQNAVIQDEKVPANQRAQTLNATAAVLGQIAKIQQDVYTTERLKRIESKLVETLKTFTQAQQEAFFTVTEQLSDQGRVLVPGLTMGVLGQDYIGGETGPMPVNSTYAQTLENQFRQSGIMHLMAVSGGHFVLVAGLVRRLCMWMLLDRRLTALLVSGVYVLLALAMFPSDSVTRAFIMGLIGALTYAMGRRTQALSALCWTVIGVLAVNPDMSASYGFALSSAAVLGIVLFAERLAGAFERAMPHGIAEMMAMTVAAQLFTLPIQVLMEPELPLLSVPANLLVSPFVGLATMAGLMALACAWCEPWLAGVFAWISSWGTLVMERVALWLGGSTMAVIPWKDGVTGAVLIVAVEIGIGMLLVFVSRCLQHVRRYEAGMPGVRFGSAWHVRLSLWCEETRRLFTRRQAE